MLYYTHHLGDYMRDTAHLSMLEDSAYRRLLDAYYIRETPLPTDIKECCKLARAATKQERDAVAYVLAQFFTLESYGYHQSRADAEISKFRSKSSKAKDSAKARWDTQRNECEDDANALRTDYDGIAFDLRTKSEIVKSIINDFDLFIISDDIFCQKME